MTKKHTAADLPVGTEIYYTGDMANQSGFGVVSALHGPDKWYGGSVDILMEDGREMRRLHFVQFDQSPGRRFMTKTEYTAKREADIAQMKAEYERIMARRAASHA